MSGGLATGAELGSAPAPVPTPDNLRTLLARARAAARELDRPDEPLGWAEAMALAPWPKAGPPAFEREFRKAFAEGLVKRGIAKPAAKAGKKSGKPGTPTKLMRRLLSATPEEFAAQDKLAEAAGLSWSTWARRDLSRTR